MTTTAGTFLNHCRAGLILAGQTEDRNPEWIGHDKSWNVAMWIEDGVIMSDESISAYLK